MTHDSHHREVLATRDTPLTEFHVLLTAVEGVANMVVDGDKVGQYDLADVGNIYITYPSMLEIEH